MDDRRFDALTRALGRGGSRRALLKGLLGLGGITAIGAILRNSAPVEAQRRPTPTPRVPQCPGNQIPCGDGCCCPSGTEECGSACCPTNLAQCCDGACCYGTCFEGGLCCAPGQRACNGYCIPADGCCADSECAAGRCLNYTCVPYTPTSVPTNTPVQTATPTKTAVPPTATKTQVPPSSTPTKTPAPPTNTPTKTAVPPSLTPTRTPTPSPTRTPSGPPSLTLDLDWVNGVFMRAYAELNNFQPNTTYRVDLWWEIHQGTDDDIPPRIIDSKNLTTDANGHVGPTPMSTVLCWSGSYAHLQSGSVTSDVEPVLC